MNCQIWLWVSNNVCESALRYRRRNSDTHVLGYFAQEKEWLCFRSDSISSTGGLLNLTRSGLSISNRILSDQTRLNFQQVRSHQIRTLLHNPVSPLRWLRLLTVNPWQMIRTRTAVSIWVRIRVRIRFRVRVRIRVSTGLNPNPHPNWTWLLHSLIKCKIKFRIRVKIRIRIRVR